MENKTLTLEKISKQKSTLTEAERLRMVAWLKKDLYGQPNQDKRST